MNPDLLKHLELLADCLQPQVPCPCGCGSMIYLRELDGPDPDVQRDLRDGR